jgi:hypothetical protein
VRRARRCGGARGFLGDEIDGVGSPPDAGAQIVGLLGGRDQPVIRVELLERGGLAAVGAGEPLDAATILAV